MYKSTIGPCNTKLFLISANRYENGLFFVYIGCLYTLNLKGDIKIEVHL